MRNWKLKTALVGLALASQIAVAQQIEGIAHAVFSGNYAKLEEFDEKKVCSKGKPCGKTCININYVCRIDNPQPSVPTFPSTPVPTPDKPAIPEIALKPRPSTCSTVQVAGVIDGDTLLVDTSTSRARVRVSQVDAPETSQAYGREAKACLASIVANQAVSMCTDGTDRYGRVVANVYAGPTDVGQELVRRGCAWAYSKYLEFGSALPALQAQAQEQHIGLWSEPAIAPWEYRGGSAPVPVTSTGATPVTVTTTTMATPINRILDWAESVFPAIFQSGGENIVVEEGSYRCYENQICAGSLNDIVMVYNTGVLTPVSSEVDLLPAVGKDGY